MRLGRPAEEGFTDSLLHAPNRCSYTVIALKNEITQELARELLDYDPDTGVLTWRQRPREMFSRHQDWATWNKRFSGARAGWVTTDARWGYQARSIGILGRKMLEHRVVWVWMTGDVPPEQIDHENRDATDNRWSNLRASNSIANGHNQSKRKSNKSGYTGVSWEARSGKWRAQCRNGGNSKHLGYFEDPCLAYLAVLEFREKNGFNVSHGRDVAKYHSR